MRGGTGDRREFLRRSVGAVAAVPCVASARAGAADGRGSTLRSLLARNQGKHPGQRVSNHTSMALMSLAALGSSEQHLRELGEHHLSRWAPFPESGPAVDARGWRERLGDSEALFGFRALFREEIRRRGVRGHVARVPAGFASGAGRARVSRDHPHGLRRALRRPEEVAIGLAYWAVTYLPLGPLADPGPAEQYRCRSGAGGGPGHAGADRRGPQGRGHRQARRDEHRRQHAVVVDLQGFTPASALRVGPGSLAAIARAMLGMYLGSGDNFTALHAVTGTHAYRMIEPFIDVPIAAPGAATCGRRWWRPMCPSARRP